MTTMAAIEQAPEQERAVKYIDKQLSPAELAPARAIDVNPQQLPQATRLTRPVTFLSYREEHELFECSVVATSTFANRLNSPNAHLGRSLAALKDEIETSVRKAALELVRTISTSDSVYPTISPDGGGGAVLYWRAGPLSLEVDLEADSNFYIRFRDLDADRLEERYEAPIPRTFIATRLAALSEYAADANPEWRSFFAR